MATVGGVANYTLHLGSSATWSYNMTSTSIISGHKKRPSSTMFKALDLGGKVTKPDGHYSKAGGFSDVYKCRYISDDLRVKEVAVKVFRFHFEVAQNEGKATKTAKMIRRELGIWRRLSHPNIVQFLGFVYDFERHGSTSLVSEWMPNGTLEDFFAQHDDQLRLSHRLQLLSDIANGLLYLHTFPLVHGDLTCTNVLIDENLNARLTDFGLASMVGDIPDGLRYLQMTTTRPGAIRWAAPEHFSVNTNSARERTTKSDIYSFGNLALLTLSGEHPWAEVSLDIAVVFHLHQGDKPSRPASRPIEDKHWEFIQRCWLAVDRRPQAEDLVFSLMEFLGTCSPNPFLWDFLKIHSLCVEPPDATSSLRVVAKPPQSEQKKFGHLCESLRCDTPSTSYFQLHPLLNGGLSLPSLYFSFASPSFTPHRYTGAGQPGVFSDDELREPATYPPITRMRVTHDDIPQWAIDVEFHYASHTIPTPKDPITIGDVLHTIYDSLHADISPEEGDQVSRSKGTAILHTTTWGHKSALSTSPCAGADKKVKPIDYLPDNYIFKMLVRTHGEDGFYCWKLMTVSKRSYYLR